MIKFPSYGTVGIIVKDIDVAIEQYSKLLGWSDWNVADHDFSEVLYKGKPSGCKVRAATFPNPSNDEFTDYAPIELLSPIAGESPYKDFLREKGEGICFLKITVDDLQEKLQELSKNGCSYDFMIELNYPGMKVREPFVTCPSLGGLSLHLLEIAPEE